MCFFSAESDLVRSLVLAKVPRPPSRSRSRNRPVSVGPDLQSLRSYSTSTTTSSTKTFQQSTNVTKLTFSEETKTESCEKKVPEVLERGRTRQKKVFTPASNSDYSGLKQGVKFDNSVPEKSKTFVAQRPLSYHVKIVREEEVQSPVKAIVKIGLIEPQRATFKNAPAAKSDVSEATSGQKATLDQPTYRDYILNKRQARRPISYDGSSLAYSR